jgi:signal transduction histidine kinase
MGAVTPGRPEGRTAVIRMRGADGAWHWMEARAVLFQPPIGEPRIVSVTRDISDRKQAEEDLERRVADRTRELEDALGQLRAEVERREQIQESLHRAQHLASIGTLAAGIAHEINNPVGSILAAADEAQNLYAEPAARGEVETLLRKISHEATRCGRVVKSVLALSRQLPNERWIGDLNEVVRSARDHLQELIASNAARVELELEPEITPFPMNPTELEQVVVNLVRNAIENGGHGVRVRIRTEPAARGVRLRVLDDGPGIPIQEQGRIFDPFNTTRRSQGGAGLGLSLVHGIVAGHGGSVEVRGAPGSGTEFVLEFHVTEAHA